MLRMPFITRGARTAKQLKNIGAFTTTIKKMSNVDKEAAVKDPTAGRGLDTLAVHAGYEPDREAVYGVGQGAPCGVPLYRTIPFLFKNTEHAKNLFSLKELGNIYTRIMNPTTHVLDSRYAQMEGGHPLSGLCVASGMCAITYAILNLAQHGDNIVTASNLYGGTHTMFSHSLCDMGIEVRFVDGNDPENFVKAMDSKTRAFFCESCSNPGLEISDLEAISSLAHDHGVPLICDSTFSTPVLTRPFDFGVDILANALTKWVGGHGTCIGGIIVDKGEFSWKGGRHPLYDKPDNSYGGIRWGHDLPDELSPLAYILRARTVSLRNLGGCISPDNSWMILQGIETLGLRMERHCENSLKVAEYLQDHPNVEWVRYPGLSTDSQYEKCQKYLSGKGGGVVVFGLKSNDPHRAGQLFIDSLVMIRHVSHVGDVRTLACHPATTTHSQLSTEEQVAAGCPPEMVRLSIGIECIEDILADLDAAFSKLD